MLDNIYYIYIYIGTVGLIPPLPFLASSGETQTRKKNKKNKNKGKKKREKGKEKGR